MLIIAFIWMNMSFKWSENANLKFKKLKAIFITASILV